MKIKNRKLPLVVEWSWASLFAFGLIDATRGPVFPEVVAQFGLSDTAGSLFFFSTSMIALLHNLVLSHFLAVTEPQTLLISYTLLLGAGAALMAVAPGWIPLLIACGVLGAAVGGVGVAHNGVVTTAIPEAERRRWVLGVLHAMYGLASLVAPLCVTFLRAAGFGWRGVLAVVSLPSFFLGISWIITVRKQWFGQQLKRPPALAPKPFPREWFERSSWLAASGLSLFAVAEVSVTSRFVLWARREGGWDADQANLGLSLFFLLLLCSRLAVGLMKPRWDDRKVIWGSGVSAAVLLVLALLLNSCWPMVLAGLFIGILYPLGMNLLAERFGEKTMAVTGLAVTVQALFLMSTHLAIGIIADATSLTMALMVAPLSAFVALLFVDRVFILEPEKVIPSLS